MQRRPTPHLVRKQQPRGKLHGGWVHWLHCGLRRKKRRQRHFRQALVDGLLDLRNAMHELNSTMREMRVAVAHATDQVDVLRYSLNSFPNNAHTPSPTHEHV